MKSARGFTLLEAMVALVILGLVIVAYLELFGNTVRVASSADDWSRAVTYAEDELQRLQLDRNAVSDRGADDKLATGFEKQVFMEPWRQDQRLQLVTVAVSMPGGGALHLSRLMDVR
jgi:prepilin-type N-terminal cleavage/methylation domain-containing protein